MAQAITGCAFLPKTSPTHATRSTCYTSAAQRRTPARQLCSRLRSSSQDETTGSLDQSQEPVRTQQEERFVSVSDLLAEVSSYCRVDSELQLFLRSVRQDSAYRQHVTVVSCQHWLILRSKTWAKTFVFEDTDEDADVWGHEQRLRAQAPSGEAECLLRLVERWRVTLIGN